jgi:putative methionine-R-sulfoxide reductase with GAF domain
LLCLQILLNAPILLAATVLKEWVNFYYTVEQEMFVKGVYNGSNLTVIQVEILLVRFVCDDSGIKVN